jgi:8-oxo-dGTP pyrophosphatase MutT (NUDIX family)
MSSAAWTPSSGDGWTRCARGHRHWGRYGAAGLLLRHRASDGETSVLLQHRAAWSHHGDTWGLLGGARGLGETAEQAATREAWEEAGVAPSTYTVTGSYLDDHGGWSYITVIAIASALLPITQLNAESTQVAWVPLGDVARLPLHPGFAVTWPTVRALLD